MSASIKRAGVWLVTASFAVALATPTAALARYDSSARPSSAPAAATDVAATQTADDQLASDLIYMREEERLAHDVYTKLADVWGVRIFSNIAVSEQRHTDAVAVLLDRYGVPDPASSLPAGTYSIPELQELYDQLIEQGTQSLTEAFEVGRLIEVTDIADLEERIAHTTQSDVLTVYENLLAGSENHLAAFTSQLTGTTGTARRGR